MSRMLTNGRVLDIADPNHDLARVKLNIVN